MTREWYPPRRGTSEVRAISGVSARRLSMLAGAAGIAWLTVSPLAFLLRQSFLPVAGSRFTVGNYAFLLGSGSWSVLANSLAFAAGSAALALAAGTLLAWLNERTDVPLKPLFYAFSIVPLVIPSMLLAIAWTFLA